MIGQNRLQVQNFWKSSLELNEYFAERSFIILVLHIASAIVSELNLVIASQPCSTKTGEITAFRELMALLDVSGAIVVANALHCNPTSHIRRVI